MCLTLFTACYGDKDYLEDVENYGFRDQDARCYELLQAIYSRPSFENEDWLIIITADHGGIQTWHGGQTLEERTTWIACNKAIDSKYFSSGYDGYKTK